MNSLERRAEADLPDLVQYLDDALSLTERLVSSVKFSENDRLGFIILAFLRKLEEQARSVQMLVFNDHGRDAELVARSMLETMISALWIARDPDRARQWQGYAYIEDWRLAEKRPDIPISPERRQAIDNFLLKYGKFYEDPHKRGKSDPYYNNWRCGVSIRQMFNPSSTVANLKLPFKGHYRTWEEVLAPRSSFTSRTDGGIATPAPCNTLPHTPLSGVRSRYRFP